MTPSSELLDAARSARERAYAPYSNFRVGAAVKTADGAIVGGCNVENASYGLSICAERVALTAAVAAGHTRILAIAIAGPPDTETAPCGACRQFIAEFDSAMPVTFTTAGEPVCLSLAELLPHSFGPHSLHDASSRL
ncbi:MAG: cytidine deaminase [Candidatus Eremiobacteraeota bacterium]|nr:cytidine deaminase [Candidatus Eremiobacteraeota bacterium]